MVANLDTRIEVTPRPNESINGWEKRINRAIIQIEDDIRN
jgi:hypothetical protein